MFLLGMRSWTATVEPKEQLSALVGLGPSLRRELDVDVLVTIGDQVGLLTLRYTVFRS